MTHKKKFRNFGCLFWLKNFKQHDHPILRFNQPSVYHALVVIFLEFFSWGLVMSPVITAVSVCYSPCMARKPIRLTVLNDAFPDHTFLMNGLIQGVKGFLSFLSAPLIGALSDVFGRKPFLLLTVTFTCAPIPLMKLSPWWYFALMSISGVFSVTFSVVFAYVADVTSVEERSAAYGLVSATFAASLVTSPAIGAYLGRVYSENLVIALATVVAVLDFVFILLAVPESLVDKCRSVTWASQLAWEKADPFKALRRIGQDFLILMLCVTVFLSYLPEAGEYSSFFVYLRLVMGFNPEEVATFVAVVGVMSVISQTLILALLMKYVGSKHSIIIGLVFEMIQLFMLGFGSQAWVIWCAGAVAAASSITYPAISAFVSTYASSDQQGVAQGMITGIRGLCNGLGPAMFGFVFYLFHVDLSDNKAPPTNHHVMLPARNGTRIQPERDETSSRLIDTGIMPGPPFAFGAVLVILALFVALFIPENPNPSAKTSYSRPSCVNSDLVDCDDNSEDDGHLLVEYSNESSKL